MKPKPTNIIDPFFEIKRPLIDSIKKNFPVESEGKILKLTDIWVSENKDPKDLAAQKLTKNKNKSWTVPVYGSMELIDSETGKKLDSTKRVKLAELPLETPRLSYIINGVEYQVPKLLRLKPGVYTRMKQTGEVESQVNTGKGVNFKVNLTPETGKFDIMAGGSQSHVSLYPILKAVGVSDNDIMKSWGKKVYESNLVSEKKGRKEVERLYRLINFGQDPESYEEAVNFIKDYFENNTSLDEGTTQITLGQKFKAFSPEAILSTSNKLLKVNRGEEKADDRDSLVFKKAMGIGEFIGERIAHQKHVKKNQNQIKHNVSKYDDITKMVNASIFTQPITDFITRSQVSTVANQRNPLSMIEEDTKATVIGADEGGIGEKHSVTEGTRDVHPSYAGFIDPIHTPESEMVGAVNHLTSLTTAKDGNLLTWVWDVKNGKQVQVTPQDIFESYTAMPGEYDGKSGFKSKKVKALHRGDPTEIDNSKIKYAFLRKRGFFSQSSNLIPFLGDIVPIRASYASRMMSQALPIQDPEVPLVQVASEGMPKGRETQEKAVGKFFTVSSPITGKVTSINKDYIYISGADGKKEKVSLYNNFPLESDTYIDSTPVVKVGDTIKEGDLLADNNYTKGGVLALGKNLKTAYIPARGYNFEDSIVISETAANKMSSKHMYRYKENIGDNGVLNLKKFQAHHPGVISSENSSKLGSDGIVKPGQIVNNGDVIIAMMRNMPLTPDDIMVGRLGKSLVSPLKNKSIVWDNQFPGEVVDVQRTGKDIVVNIKTVEPAQPGDKLVGRSANKGVIGKILPDSEMPQNKDGDPFEVLLNPLGVGGRMNVNQLHETAASKIAERTGKPYLVENFSGDDEARKILGELKSLKLSDTEKVFDPSSGNEIGDISTGKQFFMKLDHQAAKKMSARFRGPSYTVDMIPAKDKGQSAMKVERGIFNALLSHGARDVIRDLSTYTAEKNDDVWTALQTGRALPVPKKSFAFEKFEGLIKGTGVNVERRGDFLKLVPFTDKEILDMSSGRIKEPKMVKGHKFEPEKGGLFDPAITGGLKGKRWAHMKLVEPMPNPIFESAIKRLCGLTGKQFQGIISGEMYVTDNGDITSEKTKYTGGKGIQKLLSKVNIDLELEKARKRIKEIRGPQEKDNLRKKIKILKSLKENNLDPSVYIVKNLPIIPPVFRPAYPLPSGKIEFSSINELYKNFGEINDSLEKIKGLGDEHKTQVRKDLYQSLGAIMGLDDPLVNRDYKGILKYISGNQPKTGFFQTKVFGKYQDLAARAVAAPDPSLHVDELGIPEKASWTLFKPFVIKKLHSMGYSPLQSKKMIESRDPAAKRALEAVMADHPVVMNRAPTLHKFGVMAFNPKMVSGHIITAHPLIVGGYNLDFDGDQVQLFTPVTDKAKQDAYKMLPSKNLYNPRDGSLMVKPSKGSITGLYNITTGKRRVNRKFLNESEVIKAYKNNDIRSDDIVTLRGSPTPVGQIIVNDILPDSMRKYNRKLTSSGVKELLSDVSKKYPEQFPEIAEKLTSLGFDSAYDTGTTLSLKDLVSVDKTKRDRIVRETQSKFNAEKDPDRLLQIATKAESEIRKGFPTTDANNLIRISHSGEKPSLDNIQQMIATPLIMKALDGTPLRSVIKKSYGEGLDLDDYWMAARGSRRAMIDRTLSTSKPGEFAKVVLDNMVNQVVTIQDCGTKEGVMMAPSDKECLERVLMEPVKSGAKIVVPSDTIITPEVVNTMKSHSVGQIKVRSPLKCKAPQGICSKCMGLDEHGGLPPIGTNMGAKIGQGVSEPVTQMVLRAFHSGGKLESNKTVVDTFGRIDDLLKLPKSPSNKAVLSRTSGVVNKVETNPAGGKNIYINDIKHFVPPSQSSSVKKGQKIQKGDFISTGLGDPQEILELKGKDKAQEFITDELYDLYQGGGTYNKKRNIELITKGISEYSRVIDPGDSEYDVGDLIKDPWKDEWNKSVKSANPLRVPVKDSYGKVLAEDIGQFHKGVKIDSKVQDSLSKRHLKNVSVEPSPIEVKPALVGIGTLPRVSDDWIERLTFEDLKKSMQESAERGYKSEIHGVKPYPAIAYGAEFGIGKDGKY